MWWLVRAQTDYMFALCIYCWFYRRWCFLIVTWATNSISGKSVVMKKYCFLMWLSRRNKHNIDILGVPLCISFRQYLGDALVDGRNNTPNLKPITLHLLLNEMLFLLVEYDCFVSFMMQSTKYIYISIDINVPQMKKNSPNANIHRYVINRKFRLWPAKQIMPYRESSYAYMQ